MGAGAAAAGGAPKADAPKVAEAKPADAKPAEAKTVDAPQSTPAEAPRAEQSLPEKNMSEEPAESSPVETASTPANEPPSSGSPMKTVGIASLATGGAGLVGGAVFGILAAAKHKDLNNSCGGSACPPSQHGAVDEYHTFATLSTASLLAGGGATAVGLVLLIGAPSAPPRREQAKPKIVPYVGVGTAGAMGRF